MLNKYEVPQFMRFCAIGAANTAVDFITFFLLTAAGVPYMAGQIAAYSAGVINSFVLNRRWTFKVRGHINITEVQRFILVNLTSLLVSSGILFILHDTGRLDLWVSKIIATGAGLGINYLGSRFWVFVKKAGPIL